MGTARHGAFLRRGSGNRVRAYFASVALLLFSCIDPEMEAVDDLSLDAEVDALSVDALSAWTAPVVPPCFFDISGSACTTEWGTPGVCLDEGFGYVYCAPRGSCRAETAGEPCVGEWGERGGCTAIADKMTYCRFSTPPVVEIDEDIDMPDSGSAVEIDMETPP